jgi:succinate semialdehyde reductase (NADPH)
LKAAVLERAGSAVSIQDIADPKPRQSEVLLKVAACGVCHSDLHVMKGEIGFPMPCVLGHEVSGVVEEVGPGVTNLRRGDHVVASFILPCGRCGFCVQGRDDLCEAFFALNRGRGALFDGETRLYREDGTAIAMFSAGGLAEYAVVPDTAAFALPLELDLEEACILGCAVPTAYGAVRHQGQVMPGQSVAVIGVGGVGLNIVQFARTFGASDIIAVDIRDDKLESALQLGATMTINAAREDAAARLKELTGGRGVDVAFEALGRPETVVQAFEGVCDGGSVVVVGLAVGTAAAPIEITRLVRRSLTVKGSYGARMRTDLPELIRLAARGLVTTSI